MSDGEAQKQRLYFFDNLRAFIVLLVIVFHVAMGYTTWNLAWWYVNDTQKSLFFDLFILETDVYIMPIMFLIAGYFSVPVLQKKGTVGFWREKLRRIALPWIVGVLLIAPLIAYSAFFSRMATPPEYFLFWKDQFWGAYYQQAHYWFLGILALFFLLATVAYKIKPSCFAWRGSAENPSMMFFPLFALLTAVPFFAANLFYAADAWINAKYLFMIQPVRIGLYFCYFGLGIYAWRNAWFTSGGYRPRLPRWGVMAGVMLFVFLAYRVSFTVGPVVPPLFKAGHAVVYAVFCLAVTMAFIAAFQRFFGDDAWLWRKFAANSYTIYFIHQCVVIPLAYLVQAVQINVWLKYLGVSVASVALCFLIAEYVISPALLMLEGDKGKAVGIKSNIREELE